MRRKSRQPEDPIRSRRRRGEPLHEAPSRANNRMGILAFLQQFEPDKVILANADYSSMGEVYGRLVQHLRTKGLLPKGGSGARRTTIRTEWGSISLEDENIKDSKVKVPEAMIEVKFRKGADKEKVLSALDDFAGKKLELLEDVDLLRHRVQLIIRRLSTEEKDQMAADICRAERLYERLPPGWRPPWERGNDSS